MKATSVVLRADCTLELTEKEVAILHHYLCYGNKDLAAHLITKVSQYYKVDEIVMVLDALRDSLEKAMASTAEARKHVFDERYGK